MKNKRVILIGQAPGRGDGEPLSGSIGKKLAKLMGMKHEHYLEAFERINVLDEWPGKSGKGDAFPSGEARRSAEAMKRNLIGMTAIMFGRKVGEAFGIRSEYFERVEVDGLEATVVPHPSGVNRWWNDGQNRKRAARFFARLGREAKKERTWEE